MRSIPAFSRYPFRSAASASLIRFPRRVCAFPLVVALLAPIGCGATVRMHSPELSAGSGPVSPWPAPVPIRLKPERHDDLLVMILGPVETPLANGMFDPTGDRVTLADGSTIENYYKEQLDVAFFEPLDKSVYAVPPSGWCSWYYYYQEITAEEVLANARWIAKHLAPYGAQYVQIDDGWQGGGHGLGGNRDWTTIDVRFRELGMDNLAAEIRKLGLKAGIWLAPHGQSNEQIAKASGAFLWKGDGTSASTTWEGTYLVDPSIPAGHEHLHKMFKTMRDWGYTYFKIDGQPIVLREYERKAEYMGGEVNVDIPVKERAERLYRKTLQTIRKAIGPETFLLGCWGIPLPGVGILNGSRTSGDVVQGWQGFLVANDAVQKWNFMHNIAWYCDPDVCYVRPPLSEGTARAWATIQGLSGQALLTSDRLPDLPPSRVEMLKRIYPAVDIRPLDLFRPDHTRKSIWDLKVNHLGRSYDVVGVFNFNERESKTCHVSWRELGLEPERVYHVYDFWQRTYLGAWEQGVFLDIPPADVRVVTLVPEENRPVLVSTSRHITQGWTDLQMLTAGGTTEKPLLKGRSLVIGGDPYTLVIGLPRSAPTFKLVRVRAKPAKGFARGQLKQVEYETHQGYATVALRTKSTQVIAWELHFEPAEPFVYPAPEVRGLKARANGLSGAIVTWNTPYSGAAGFEVTVDGKPFGVAFEPRAALRNLAPGQSYQINVRSVWYEGSRAKDAAEASYAPKVPAVLQLSDLKAQIARQDWGGLGRNCSVEGNALTVGGEQYERGLGTHAKSVLAYNILGAFARFEARVGIDDEATPPEPVGVIFEVWGDGQRLWVSEIVRSGDAPVSVAVDIAGIVMLELRVLPGDDGINYDHADWLEARIIADGRADGRFERRK